MKKLRIYLWLIGIFMSIAFIIYIVGIGNDAVEVAIQNILAVIPAVAAVVSLLSLFIVSRNENFNSTKWLFLAVGIFLYCLGELSWMIYEVVLGKDPFPSVADLFWLVGYIPLFIGLIMTVAETKASLISNRTPLLCLVIGMITAVSIVFLISPILQSSEITLVEKALDLAYPLGDLLLVIPALGILILYERGLLGKPWQFILIGFVCFSVADLLFSYFTWMEIFDIFPFYMIDLLWASGYFAIAIGAVYERMIIETIICNREISAPEEKVPVGMKV